MRVFGRGKAAGVRNLPPPLAQPLHPVSSFELQTTQEAGRRRMTISFLTLFFGLLSGPLPVQMAVSGPVAAVELTVDGGSPVRLTAAPWSTTLDLGPELLPHRIVARALDAHGSEVARAEEWANLPHPKAKAEIVLEGGAAGGPPVAARVVWTNLMREKLESVALKLDGHELRLDGAGRARLPDHDLKTFHILAAEVRFSPHRVVRKDVAYGGEYGSEISTELTAVPVRLRSRSLPPPEKLVGWFAAGGQPLAVAAVEEGPGQVFVVRVPSSFEDVRKLGARGMLPRDLQFDMRLEKEDRIRFVHPYPERIDGTDQRAELFNLSAERRYGDGGLAFWIRVEGVAASRGTMELPNRFTKRQAAAALPAAGAEPPARPEMHIADAVAVAALQALEENRRRAVLLVLNGDELEDYSRYDAATVRRFLASLRIPLYVWTLGKTTPGSFATAWGPTVAVDATPALYRAVEDLRKDLQGQRIVLVDGRRVPDSVILGPAARDVELVSGGGG